MEDRYRKLYTGGDDQSLTSADSHQPDPIDSQLHIISGRQRSNMGSKTTLLLVAIVTGVLALSIGVLIGWFSSQGQLPNTEAYNIWEKALEGEDEAIREMILEELKAANIKENLR